MTDNELYSMFITVGQIVSAKIMRDKSSGYSYGYGFVHYQQPEDAAKAIASLNGLQVHSRQRYPFPGHEIFHQFPPCLMNNNDLLCVSGLQQEDQGFL